MIASKARFSFLPFNQLAASFLLFSPQRLRRSPLPRPRLTTVKYLAGFSYFLIVPINHIRAMSTTSHTSDIPTIGHDETPRLTRSQRSRRVKSARKLTKILGENPQPQVNIPSSLSSSRKKSLEGGVAALCSPIISVTRKLVRVALEPLQVAYRRDFDSEWEDLGSSKSGPADFSHGVGWSPVLLAQAEPRLPSRIDDPTSYISSQTPSPSASSFRKRASSLFSISTSWSFLPSPLEWERWKEEREARNRRRRVAKLARYLGERIPPDLVLPNPGPAKTGRGSPRKRFPPPITPPVTPVVPPIWSESPTSHQGTPLSPSPPSSLAEGPRPAVEKTAECLETTEPGPSSPDSEVASPRSFAQEHWDAHRELSISSPCECSTQRRPCGYFEVEDNVDAMSMTVEDGRESENHSTIQPPRSESRLAFLRLRSATSSPEPRAVSHRSERRQGWSGEWNVGNMQDVISKLRDLR
jgi:hypothetical protein